MDNGVRGGSWGRGEDFEESGGGDGTGEEFGAAGGVGAGGTERWKLSIERRGRPAVFAGDEEGKGEEVMGAEGGADGRELTQVASGEVGCGGDVVVSKEVTAWAAGARMDGIEGFRGIRGVWGRGGR